MTAPQSPTPQSTVTDELQPLFDAVCRAEGIPWKNRGDGQRRRVKKVVAEILATQFAMLKARDQRP